MRSVGIFILTCVVKCLACFVGNYIVVLYNNLKKKKKRNSQVFSFSSWHFTLGHMLGTRLAKASEELRSIYPKEGHGTDHLKCHQAAHRGQPGDQAQSTRAVSYSLFLEKKK